MKEDIRVNEIVSFNGQQCFVDCVEYDDYIPVSLGKPRPIKSITLRPIIKKS